MRYTRRDFLQIATLAGCGYLSGCMLQTVRLTEKANQPHVILIMTDDQGWGDVSYNGLTRIKTPNLDAMAAAGMRFNRFYAQQSCSPARA